MNARADHQIWEYSFSWNTFAGVDCREKDHKRHFSTVLQEEYYNNFPKK